MPEEVLFKAESVRSRGEIADHLRAVADKLDAGEAVTLSSGADSVTLEIPDRPTFEVKAERETSGGGGPGELSLEFELEWDEGADESESGTFAVE